jgi:predicted  nucleic acid-binding Zn-ribbon protein
MFKCQECGRKFKTSGAAERAASDGCPKCGGVDIDLDTEATAGGGISPVRKSKPDRLPLFYDEADNPSNGWESPEPRADSLHPEGL